MADELIQQWVPSNQADEQAVLKDESLLVEIVNGMSRIQDDLA